MAGRQRKVHRQLRQRKKHRTSRMFVGMVTILMAGTIGFSSFHLKQKISQYEAQEYQLTAEIEAEKERTEEIDELEKYVQTEEFVRNTAKEKLGLVSPGEIIFKAK